MNESNVSAQEIRRRRAAQMKFRRDLADFKKFVALHIGQLERGKSIAMIANVVTDPCGPKMVFRSILIKGPPA